MGASRCSWGRRIDRGAMNAAATERCSTASASHLDPTRPARGLSVADQQIVEIAKAISFDARVIVMDEPTAALTAIEVERLFAVVRTLRAEGAAVLFISHRLEEVFANCQRVTIMRDGRFVRTDPIEDLDHRHGHPLDGGPRPRHPVPQDRHDAGRGRALRSSTSPARGEFNDVSFTVRRGEIVALAGLVGAGRSEIARAIFGIDRYDAGRVEIDGNPLPSGVADRPRCAAGVGFVPEDRRQQGLVMEISIDHNVALASLRRLQHLGLLRRSSERQLAAEWARRLQLKFSSLANNVSTLSGGNQQKVVLGKWLARHPKLLIIDEPTRGIDVGTKAEVHRLLDELVADGIAVLMISSELPEVLGMADRVLVMHEGRLVAEHRPGRRRRGLDHAGRHRPGRPPA